MSHKPQMSKVAEMLLSLPPHAMEAEAALLGSILIDPKCLARIMAIVRKESFMRPANAIVFEHILRVQKQRNTVDIVLLNQSLADGRQLQIIGGRDYLVTLATSVPSAAHAEYYARLIAEKFIVRCALEWAGNLVCDLQLSPEHASDHIVKAIRNLNNALPARQRFTLATAKPDTRHQQQPQQANGQRRTA
jgi:replicative DNA helicase